MGCSAACRMDIEADNLSSQHFLKSGLETRGVVMNSIILTNAGHPQHSIGMQIRPKLCCPFLLKAIKWSVQQLNIHLKSILLDEHQEVSNSYLWTFELTLLNAFSELYSPLSRAFSHVLHAALIYTCISALLKLDLTERLHPRTGMTSYPNEKNSSVNGQMGKIPLLGRSGANGLLFTTTTPHCVVQLQVRVQLLPWCRQ